MSLPILQPFDGTSKRSVVFMDNCSIHHVDSITTLFEEAGVLLLFLPPYSPVEKKLYVIYCYKFNTCTIVVCAIGMFIVLSARRKYY